MMDFFRGLIITSPFWLIIRSMILLRNIETSVYETPGVQALSLQRLATFKTLFELTFLLSVVQNVLILSPLHHKLGICWPFLESEEESLQLLLLRTQDFGGKVHNEVCETTSHDCECLLHCKEFSSIEQKSNGRDTQPHSWASSTNHPSPGAYENQTS